MKVIDYGHTFKKDHGKKGSCQTVYLTPDYSRPLTEEELAIKRQCAHLAYEDTSDRIVQIDEAYHNKEIDQQMRQEELGNLNTEFSYLTYIELLKEKLGFVPVRSTQLQQEHNWE